MSRTIKFHHDSRPARNSDKRRAARRYAYACKRSAGYASPNSSTTSNRPNGVNL